MTIHLSPVKEPPTPSLSATLGLYGKVHFIPQQGFWIASEENEPELIEVAIVRKRKLHVITDQMLAAQRDMATNTSDRGLMGNFNFRGAYA